VLGYGLGARVGSGVGVKAGVRAVSKKDVACNRVRQ